MLRVKLGEDKIYRCSSNIYFCCHPYVHVCAMFIGRIGSISEQPRSYNDECILFFLKIYINWSFMYLYMDSAECFFFFFTTTPTHRCYTKWDHITDNAFRFFAPNIIAPSKHSQAAKLTREISLDSNGKYIESVRYALIFI